MTRLGRSVLISDRSSIGEARRFAVALAEAMGFDEERRSDVGIVVTEAATNILLHAQKGEVLACPGNRGDVRWLDLYALDQGPGIADLGRALEDGFSTKGTAGQGLGAMQRLASGLGIYSVPGKGTVNWSRFLLEPAQPDPQLGVVNVALAGESACGDGWLVLPGSERTMYFVADGLGHGPAASEAAQEAVAIARLAAGEPAAEILDQVHDALKKTRGAAVSVALHHHALQTLTYAGVGNISAVLTAAGTSRSLVSQNGTLGAVLPRKVQEYNFPCPEGALLTMFSDGLGSKCSLSIYSGIQSRHPALLAGLLYRDFTRRRDDATVLVASMEGKRG